LENKSDLILLKDSQVFDEENAPWEEKLDKIS